MLELGAGQQAPVPRRMGLPIALSAMAQVAVMAVLVMAYVAAENEPVAAVTTTIPAFVTPVPEPPQPAPPPPPPAPRARRPKPTPAPAEPTAQTSAVPAQEPETLPSIGNEALDFDVPSGIEGGVPGGVIGGVVGGVPQPPPPAPPREPVRVGGQIKAPELLHRVEPTYPPLAVAAHVEGLVILEATVDRAGAVANVKLLRSSGTPLLDREAERALRQWRYRPLRLNGVTEPFVVTATLSFHLSQTS